MRNPPFIDRLPNGKPFIRSKANGLFGIVLYLINMFVLAKRHITELLGGFIDRRYTVGDGEQYFEVGVNYDVWKKAISSGKPVIIAVHGTGDGSHEVIMVPTRPRWWQIGSQFSTNVTSGAFSGEPAWLPFHWHGANSDTKRHEAAKGLARLCGALSDRKIPYAIIGHSHGGNIIERAFKVYSASVGNFDFCKSIVTLGSPYFENRPKIGWHIQLISKIFGLSISFLGLCSCVYIFLASDWSFNFNDALDFYYVYSFFASLFAYACMMLTLALFLYYMAKGLFETTSINIDTSALDKISNNWKSIHYKNDEVVSLLPQFANNSIAFASRNSEENSLRRVGLAIGRFLNIIILSISAAFFISWTIHVINKFIFKMPFMDLNFFNINEEYAFSGIADLVLLLYFAPVSLISTYLISVIISYLVNPVLSSLIAGGVADFKGKLVKNIIRGLAYGEDHDFKLIKTASKPQYFNASLSIIETGYSDRLSNEHFSHFKTAVYNVMSGIGDKLAFADTEALVSHLMRAIYHNAYFQDEEVIAMICDHINKANHV